MSTWTRTEKYRLNLSGAVVKKHENDPCVFVIKFRAVQSSVTPPEPFEAEGRRLVLKRPQFEHEAALAVRRSGPAAGAANEAGGYAGGNLDKSAAVFLAAGAHHAVLHQLENDPEQWDVCTDQVGEPGTQSFLRSVSSVSDESLEDIKIPSGISFAAGDHKVE
eukprot:scaffold436_cov267-Pinguiococcus_pyrenoidosus.AAC.27